MGELVMEDDLTPEAKLNIYYTGTNPFKAFLSTKSLMTNILQIPGTSYWERDFRWDISSEPRKFFARIYAKRSLDSRSHLLIEVTLKGAQPSVEGKQGELYLQLRGKLVTTYKLSSSFQNTAFYKSLLMLYNWIFYWRIRRQYLEMGKSFLLQMYDAYRKILGIS